MKTEENKTSIEEKNEALLQAYVMPCFSFDEFNSKLKELGFEVTIEKENGRDFRYHLEMNRLTISGTKYLSYPKIR